MTRSTQPPTRGARRRGNAVIEACLVIPILLLLAFGTVEFGHFFFVKHNLQGAAREGVRAAIVSGATNADVTTAVSATMTAAGLQNSGYTVATNPANISTAAEGTNISVTVQCPWGNVGLRPMGMISASKPVTATTVMRKE
jgi:Flp pilus assembly protein TadG